MEGGIERGRVSRCGIAPESMGALMSSCVQVSSKTSFTAMRTGRAIARRTLSISSRRRSLHKLNEESNQTLHAEGLGLHNAWHVGRQILLTS